MMTAMMNDDFKSAFPLSGKSYFKVGKCDSQKVRLSSFPHRDNLKVFGGDFGCAGSASGVVGGLQFNQVAAQRSLASGVERGERLLRRAVVLAEKLDRFGRRERVAHQREVAGEAHVGEAVPQARAHRGFISPTHRRRDAGGRWWQV